LVAGLIQVGVYGHRPTVTRKLSVSLCVFVRIRYIVEPIRRYVT
jgi:hypothetical protein